MLLKLINRKSIDFVFKVNKMATNTRSKTRRHDFNRDMDSDMDSEKASHYFQKSDSNYIQINEKSSETKKRKIAKHIEISYEAKEPNNWEKVLANIGLMRSERQAVVDSMGAHMCFDANALKDCDKRFQLLVSLMLSSQTRDQITHSTMIGLRERGLTVDNIINTSVEELTQLIKSVSFYRTKAKHIKETALVLRNEYNSDIPRCLEDLLKLKGVGPKMAHLAMKIAWNECTGIAVDTHVHRICNRLGWTQSKTPEQTRKQLELWLPKPQWDDINLLLVGFGQTICSPVRPKCNQCLNQKLCPFGSKTNNDF